MTGTIWKREDLNEDSWQTGEAVLTQVYSVRHRKDRQQTRLNKYRDLFHTNTYQHAGDR